jgi:hypothetical protein
VPQAVNWNQHVGRSRRSQAARVARGDSQFDGLQLVGTQKVGAHPAPVSRGPGRSFPPWNRLLKTGYIPDFSIVGDKFDSYYLRERGRLGDPTCCPWRAATFADVCLFIGRTGLCAIRLIIFQVEDEEESGTERRPSSLTNGQISLRHLREKFCYVSER